MKEGHITGMQSVTNQVETILHESAVSSRPLRGIVRIWCSRPIVTVLTVAMHAVLCIASIAISRLRAGSEL